MLKDIFYQAYKIFMDRKINVSAEKHIYSIQIKKRERIPKNWTKIKKHDSQTSLDFVFNFFMMLTTNI